MSPHTSEPDATGSGPVHAWASLMQRADGLRSGAIALDECWVQRFEVPAGHVVTLEAHAFSEQVIQVLDGCLRMTLDDVSSDLTTENVCVIPTGVHHHGTADRATSMLVITAPVGFGEDNYRLDFTEERGAPLQPVDSSVVRWTDGDGQELRGTFVSLWGVTERHHGHGGPVAVQVVEGSARVTVDGHPTTVDPSVVTIVRAGQAYSVEVDATTTSIALVVDISRTAGPRS